MEIRIPIDTASVVFGALDVIAGVILAVVYLRSARTAEATTALQARLKSSGLSRIESCELRIDELAQAIGDVANRVKMQRVRNAANHVDDNPSSKLDKLKENPEAWRAEMNRRIAGKQLVKPGED